MSPPPLGHQVAPRNDPFHPSPIRLESPSPAKALAIVVMLGETFNHTVWQGHLLYGGTPTKGDFNVNEDMYEGRLVTFSELDELRASTSRATREDENEDH